MFVYESGILPRTVKYPRVIYNDFWIYLEVILLLKNLYYFNNITFRERTIISLNSYVKIKIDRHISND